MRALENGRWLLRATNSGLTGVVSERGEITAQLPQFEPAVLRAEFAVMSGTTPYAVLGDWPVLGVVLIVLLMVLGRLRRALSETD
jgi:apolipoprotein N-acyltransferase